MTTFKNKGYLFIALFFFFNNCVTSSTITKRNNRNTSPKYELVPDWPQLPKAYALGQITGIGVDKNQNILLFHRAGRLWVEPFPDSTISLNTIAILDGKTGQLKKSWGANLFIMPHGLTVDKDNNVWVTDVALHQIFKFSYNGKLLLTLGVAKTPGNDATHFNKPTDVAIANDGSFYVGDGYGNSRVVKFSKEGKYLLEWGQKGDKPGEFKTPHGIDLDAQGNVYVADRDNNRIQKFDAAGKFLQEWKNDTAVQLYSLCIDKTTNQLSAIDYFRVETIIKGSDILQFDPGLNLVARFGRAGSYDGPICRYHDITIDNQGSIYAGDILTNRIQKFKKVLN